MTLESTCARASADLEEKIPWTAVKKSWNTRRGDWVNSVNATLNCIALSKLLLLLEAALKIEAQRVGKRPPPQRHSSPP